MKDWIIIIVSLVIFLGATFGWKQFFWNDQGNKVLNTQAKALSYGNKKVEECFKEKVKENFTWKQWYKESEKVAILYLSKCTEETK